MRLPKNYFENLTINKYREKLKLLPAVQQENARIIVTLILTFFAMSFFGIFAINPTLSTIITLQKQLSDSQIVHDSLKTKITNLSSLQQQYTQLQPDLPFVLEAIPQETKAPTLLSQIIGLAKEKQIKITFLNATAISLYGNSAPKEGTPVTQTTQASISPTQSPTSNSKINSDDNSSETSYAFSLKAQGSYDNLILFSKALTQINRIINIDSMLLNKDEKQNFLVLNLSGRAYYLK